MEKTVTEKPKLLLHSCCGPCSTAVVERLADDYDISLFFYNPNITDREEYEKRLTAQRQFLQCYNSENEGNIIRLIEGEYNPDCFYEAVKGLEDEPEGGARCSECIRLRLKRTSEKAENEGFVYFGTTLSVSPHKNHSLICQIGSEFIRNSNLRFIEDDFKKKSGFRRSVELSGKYGLYRQRFCGCEFSNTERGASKK